MTLRDFVKSEINESVINESSVESFQDGINKIPDIKKIIIDYVKKNLGCSIENIGIEEYRRKNINCWPGNTISMGTDVEYIIPWIGYFTMHTYTNQLDPTLSYIEFIGSNSEVMQLYDNNKGDDYKTGDDYTIKLSSTLYNLLKNWSENKLIKLTQDLPKGVYAKNDSFRKEHDKHNLLGRFIFAAINIISNENNYPKLSDEVEKAAYYFRDSYVKWLVKELDKNNTLVNDEYFKKLLSRYK